VEQLLQTRAFLDALLDRPGPSGHRQRRPDEESPGAINLPFPQIPLSQEEVWEQLSDAPQDTLIATLAQLIAKASARDTPPETPHE
jgi:hypothetical protein